ncbi:hypothetical protein Hanom_Chr15g01336981 [Helianthus anomalus]
MWPFITVQHGFFMREILLTDVNDYTQIIKSFAFYTLTVKIIYLCGWLGGIGMGRDTDLVISTGGWGVLWAGLVRVSWFVWEGHLLGWVGVIRGVWIVNPGSYSGRPLVVCFSLLVWSIGKCLMFLSYPYLRLWSRGHLRRLMRGTVSGIDYALGDIRKDQLGGLSFRCNPICYPTPMLETDLGIRNLLFPNYCFKGLGMFRGWDRWSRSQFKKRRKQVIVTVWAKGIFGLMGWVSHSWEVLGGLCDLTEVWCNICGEYKYSDVLSRPTRLLLGLFGLLWYSPGCFQHKNSCCLATRDCSDIYSALYPVTVRDQNGRSFMDLVMWPRVVWQLLNGPPNPLFVHSLWHRVMWQMWIWPKIFMVGKECRGKVVKITIGVFGFMGWDRWKHRTCNAKTEVFMVVSAVDFKPWLTYCKGAVTLIKMRYCLLLRVLVLLSVHKYGTVVSWWHQAVVFLHSIKKRCRLICINRGSLVLFQISKTTKLCIANICIRVSLLVWLLQSKSWNEMLLGLWIRSPSLWLGYMLLPLIQMKSIKQEKGVCKMWVRHLLSQGSSMLFGVAVQARVCLLLITWPVSMVAPVIIMLRSASGFLACGLSLWSSCKSGFSMKDLIRVFTRSRVSLLGIQGSLVLFWGADQPTGPSMLMCLLNMLELIALFWMYWALHGPFSDSAATTIIWAYGLIGEVLVHHRLIRVTSFCGPPLMYGSPSDFSRCSVRFVIHYKARVLCIPRVGRLVSYFWVPGACFG